MLQKIHSLARAGLLALSLAGGLTVSALAAPAGLAPNPAVDTTGNLIRVQGDGRYSDCMRGGDCWNRGRHWDRDRHWRGKRHWRSSRHWRDDRRWSSDRHWRRGWDRDRGHYRRHRNGPSFRIYLN